MTSLTAFLASYVVSALWQVPLLYLAGCIVAYIVRRIGPAAEHRVWIVVLLLCVIVPALPAPNMHGHSVAVAITDIHVHSNVWETSGPARGWDKPMWLSVHVMQGIVSFWLLTVLYAAARLFVGIQRTRHLLRQAQPLALQPNEAQLWQHCTQQLGLHNTVVMESEALQSPVTGSYNNQHILLLPTNFFATVAEQDAQAALAHEAAHMHRNDYRNNILLHAAAAAIFFHPFTLLLRRQLSASREMACDHAASMQVGSAHTYRIALLRLAMGIAQGRPIPQMSAAIGIFDSHSLEDRLNRLEKNMLITNTAVRYTLAAVAFLAISATASALALNGMRLLPTTESKVAASVANPAPAARAASPSPVAEASPVATPTPAPIAQSKAKLIMPVLIYQVDPEYPKSARGPADPGEHECLVRITVDTKGMPQNVHVPHSCGAAFDESSITAVRQYRFRAGTQEGKPVATDLSIMVDFKIF